MIFSVFLVCSLTCLSRDRARPSRGWSHCSICIGRSNTPFPPKRRFSLGPLPCWPRPLGGASQALLQRWRPDLLLPRTHVATLAERARLFVLDRVFRGCHGKVCTHQHAAHALRYCALLGTAAPIDGFPSMSAHAENSAMCGSSASYWASVASTSSHTIQYCC